jgi:TolB protein
LARGARTLLAALIALGCGEGVCETQGAASDGLVLVRVVDGSNDLVRVRIADSSSRPLTRTPDRDESWPYWSGSARRLVFQAAPRGRPRSIDLMLWDAATGGETPLTQTPNRMERWPSWSPDGTRLAYVFRQESSQGVAIADLRRGTRRVVAESGRRDSFWRPHFDRNGARLVAQRGVARRQSHLWILSAEGAPRPLTADGAWFDAKAHFARDGAQVVYSRRPADGGPHDVARVAVEGGAIRTLASTPEADDHSARPSPSRDEIAFVSNRDGDFDIFLADLSGERVRPLTRTPERDEFAPRWSPDGERLVVTASRAGERAQLSNLAELRTVVLDREGRVLLDVPGVMADWMPPWP